MYLFGQPECDVGIVNSFVYYTGSADQYPQSGSVLRERTVQTAQIHLRQEEEEDHTATLKP